VISRRGDLEEGRSGGGEIVRLDSE